MWLQDFPSSPIPKNAFLNQYLITKNNNFSIFFNLQKVLLQLKKTEGTRTPVILLASPPFVYLPVHPKKSDARKQSCCSALFDIQQPEVFV